MTRTAARVGALVFGLTLCVYGATTGGSMATDIMSFEVTKAIVERGSVAIIFAAVVLSPLILFALIRFVIL